MVEILTMLIIGFVAGLIARALKPGDDNLGIIMTSILGIGGALLAGFSGRFLGLYEPGAPAGFIAAIVGAVVILFIVDFFHSKKRLHH